LLLLACALVCAHADTNEGGALFSWAQQHGVIMNSLELRPLSYLEGERGIFATADIPEDTMILEIPSEVMLSEATLAGHACHDFIVEHSPLSTTNRAALHLLYEKDHLSESTWSEYIRQLPPHIPTTMFYTLEELEQLQNSTLVRYTMARKESALVQYNVVQNWIERQRAVSPCKWTELNEHGLPVFSVADWLWALSVFWSRAFSVKIDGDSMGSLVPVADMFNAQDPHSQEQQVRAVMKDNTLQYYTVGSIAKDEEIFMTYGRLKQHSNAELLMDYGFVRPVNPNDLGCVLNPFYYRSSFSHAQEKIALLDELYLWREHFCWRLGEFPHEMVWAMRILSFTPSDLDKFSVRKLAGLLAELDEINPFQPMPSVPFGIRKEELAIRMVLSAVGRTLKYYGTTLEEDMELLKAQHEERLPMTYRQYATLIVRSNEKRVLQRTAELLEEYGFHLQSVPEQEIIL